MRLVPRLIVGVAAGLALVLVTVAMMTLWSWFRTDPLESALGRLPASVQRASFTDWTAVEEQASGGSVDASSADEEMAEFLDRAFTEDLTTVSALTSSFPALAAAYGITPLDAEWEIYGQGDEGAVNVLRLSDDVDLEALEETFADLGYEEPEQGPGDSGVWIGTPELVAGLDKPLTPLQENVAVVGSERLLVSSDEPAFVEQTVEVIEGEQDSVRTEDGVNDLAAAAGEAPVAAVMWVDDFACEDLAMSQADSTDEQAGADLVEQAGGVSPMSGLVMARGSDGQVRVAMHFDSDEQAEENLQPRTDLAGGEAPGQGGSFSERFEVTSSVAEGQVVTMELAPRAERLLGDLGQGPVLFLTC